MFIRRTTIKSRNNAEPYYTHRMVESERVNGRMKQRIVLNLGRHFDVPKANWRFLSSRIEQLQVIQDFFTHQKQTVKLSDYLDGRYGWLREED